MAQIQIVFAPTANSTTFGDLADQMFFEFDGKLHFKADSERFFYVDTDQRIMVGYVGDDALDYDTNVIMIPPGTGITMMQ